MRLLTYVIRIVVEGEMQGVLTKRQRELDLFSESARQLVILSEIDGSASLASARVRVMQSVVRQ